MRVARSSATASGEVSGTAPSSAYCAASWNTRPRSEGSGQNATPPAAAFGHTCQCVSGTGASSVTSTSATSIGLASTVSPVMPMPSSLRTVERPPSAATTYRARSAEPSSNVAVTPSASWSRPLRAVPKRTSPPSSRSRAYSTSCVRACGISQPSANGTCSVGSERAIMSHSRPGSSPSQSRILGYRVPAAKISSSTPRSYRTSWVRGCRPLPREPGNRPRVRSTSVARTPRRARSAASTRPVGPAPTTRTSVVVALITHSHP